MAKSYFAILGVSSSASHDEIRRAYRRLAKEFHPDHFGGGSGLFRQIQEAYSVLGNACRRKEYEHSLSEAQPVSPVRHSGYRAPEPLIPEQQRPTDIGDISPLRSFRSYDPSFDQIFEWLGGSFDNPERAGSGKIQHLTLEVTLTRQQALRGGNARVLVPVQAVCSQCRGYGGVGPYDCWRCAGEGSIAGEVPVLIAFPAGLARDHAVVIPLERFGIRNLHLTVLFRPTDADGN